MDSVFGSSKLNRKALNVNRRTGIKQHFNYDANLGYKSKTSPSVFVYSNRGRGIQGETVNSTNTAASLIVNRNWKPIQS